MEDVVPRINSNQKLMIKYLINGESHSKPLNDESWMQWINGLQHDNILDTVLTNDDGTPAFSDQAAELTIAWYFFDGVRIQANKTKRERISEK